MGPVGGAGSVLSLSGRAREQGHPGARHLPWASQDTCRLGAERFRASAQRSGPTGPDRGAGRHHGRGLRLRLPCDAVRSADIRRDVVYRRRREHYGLDVRPRRYARPARSSASLASLWEPSPRGARRCLIRSATGEGWASRAHDYLGRVRFVSHPSMGGASEAIWPFPHPRESVEPGQLCSRCCRPSGGSPT